MGNQENNNVAVFAQREYYCAISEKTHISSFEFVLKINECRCWMKIEISNCIVFKYEETWFPIIRDNSTEIVCILYYMLTLIIMNVFVITIHYL